MQKQGVAVVAVGGNSLIKDPKRVTMQDQYNAGAESIHHIVDMIEQGWNVVITHGNGPQVGHVLRRSEIAAGQVHEVPLDYCGADTQGSIGYMFNRALVNEFKKRGMNRNSVAVVTQTIVDSNDPAFQNPTKPIGSFMTEEEAKRRAQEDGWVVVEDAGRGWRRVVASPMPVEIVELPEVKCLIEGGFVVITVGGGGIPVIEKDGKLVGTPAVIDKDFASMLLALNIEAELFVILTGVEKVVLNYGKPDQKNIDRMNIAEARKYYEEGQFPAGSMGPKILAAIDFLEKGGQEVLITSIEKIVEAFNGKTGTRIVK